MTRSEKDAAAMAHARTLANVPWCDDYEKMISGMRYDAQAAELAEGRFRARRMMHRFNTHFPPDATLQSLVAEREQMLRGMFGSVGKAPFIEPPLSFDYGCNISIGDSFYSNFKYVGRTRQPPGMLTSSLVILDCGMVTIGHRVMFGPFVSILAATHETAVESRRDGIEYTQAVSIGDDCWIGGNTTILPGVSIGKGCTVGAGSVVTRSIPDFSVAVGSPARVIKKVEPVADV